MAKKKVSTANIVMLVAALLGVVAILMLFAPGVTSKTASVLGKSQKTSVSGFKLMFGTEDGGKFNFVMFLTLIFAIAGLVGVVLSLLLNGKIGNFLAIGGFLLAGIFFFVFRAAYPMCMSDDAWKITEALIDSGALKLSLGIGAIMGGILSILAALAAAAATFAIKK